MQCLQREAKEKEFHIIAMCSESLRPTDKQREAQNNTFNWTIKKHLK